MSNRQITGHITQNALTDLKGGGYAAFTVDYDSGPVDTGAVASVTMNLTDIRCYSAGAYLQVRFDSPMGVSLAMTDDLTVNETIHSEDFELLNATNDLLTATPSTIYIGVVATSGTGNKINFREECCISLVIEYTLPPTKCKAPSNVKLSSNTSTGEAVTLSWSAGEGGTNNAASYYEIAREASADGETWEFDSWETVGTTAATSIAVEPHATPGYYYKYYVRLVGEAGEDYASPWVTSSTCTLQNPPIEQCTAATNLQLSANESSGEKVTLSWTAGSGGTHNEFDCYAVYRQTGIMTDGVIVWGDEMTWAVYLTETSWKATPPAQYGYYYRYMVITIGSAGMEYAAISALSGTLTRTRPDLTSYTDPALTPGVTKVKAAHILELQNNINYLRTGLGKAATSFTEIRAGYTSLANWTAHVLELRNAIDNSGWTHEAWIPISVNCPMAAVIEQLRRVVASI